MQFGSSPRVRGTPSRPGQRARRTRFIPACAGNANPRFRASSTAAGSSPRVRGTPDAGCASCQLPRFIPACAGNARYRSPHSHPVAVHPRVCGERQDSLCASATMTGSSPRVRGTPLSAVDSPARRRFIPACAGNAPRASLPAAPIPVHPRVCGERASRTICLARASGSSPRVRGTQRGRRYPRTRGRFIPACAGNAGRAPR